MCDKRTKKGGQNHSLEGLGTQALQDTLKEGQD